MVERPDPVTIYVDLDAIYIDSARGTFEVNGVNELNQLRTWIDQSTKSALSSTRISAATRASLDEASRMAPVSQGRPSVDAPAETHSNSIWPVSELPEVTIGKVLEQRKSVRRLLPPSARQIGSLLFHSARIRETWTDQSGQTVSSRPSPSAGARHPCDLYVFVGSSTDVPPGIFRFDPARGRMVHLADISSSTAVLEKATLVLEGPEQPPVCIFAVAKLDRTLSKYPGGLGLAILDAGALIGLMSILAPTLSLGSCALGMVSDLTVNEALKLPYPEYAQLGAIAVGALSDD